MPTELPLCKFGFVDIHTDGTTDGTPIDHTAWGHEFIANIKGGLYLCGPPGTGKSHLTRAMIATAKATFGEESVLILAPTNVAARNVGGQTVHKFFKHFIKAMEKNGPGRVKLQQEMMAYKVVFIDEISMLHSWFWGMLCALQLAYPHLYFVDVGDFNQIDPVCDVKEGLCYRGSRARSKSACARRTRRWRR